MSHISTQVMIRRYQKLQDLLAILGGISSTYLMIASLFLGHYKKYLLFKNIMDHLFVFEGKIKKKKQKTDHDNTKKNRNKFNCFPLKSKSIKLKQRTKNSDKKKRGSLETNLKVLPTQNCETEEVFQPIYPMKSSENRSIPCEFFIETQKKKIKEMENKSKPSDFIEETQKKSTIQEIKEIESEFYSTNVKCQTEIKIENDCNFQECQKKTPPISPGMKKNLFQKEEKKEHQIEISRKKTEESCENQNNIQYFDYIKYHWKSFFTMKLNEHDELVETALGKFYSEMDILMILEKVHEIDKLKSIIFNPIQRDLFELVPKMMISKSSKLKNNNKEAKEDLKKEETIEFGADFEKRLFNLIR